MVANNNVGWTYSWVLDTNTTNHYNITYSAGTNQLFTTNISKTGFTTTSTKVLIQNASGTPVLYPQQGDNTFNNNNWAVTNVYGQGIALNMSLASGGNNFEIIVVNTTGSSIITPTPVPTPAQPIPSSGTYLIPDQNQYNLNQVATIFWGMNSSIINLLYQTDIDVQRPDGTFDTTFGDFSNVQTNSINSGQVSYQVTKTGTYQIQLGKCFLTCALTVPQSKTIIATNTLNVLTPTPFIAAPANVLANQNFTVKYSFGQFALTTFDYAYIDIFNMNSGMHEGAISAILDNSTHSITNFTVSAATTYRLCLASTVYSTGNTGLVSGTCITVNSATGTLPPTQNIATSNVTLAKTSYWWQDVLTGFYAIDNKNYSRTDGGTLFWDIFNTDQGIESMYGYIGTQAENFSLVIQGDTHYIWDGKNTFLPANFITGNNQFRIFAKNNTGTFQIVNGTFTLGAVNTNGWGLKLSKYEVNTNEVFTAFVVAPADGVMQVVPSVGTDEHDYTINGTQALQLSIPDAGIANIFLNDNTGHNQQHAIVNVTDVLATPQPTQNGMSAGVTAVLNANFIPIIMIMTIFGALGMAIGGVIGAVLGFGSGFLVIAIMSMAPIWAVYLFAIIAISGFAVTMTTVIIKQGGE